MITKGKYKTATKPTCQAGGYKRMVKVPSGEVRKQRRQTRDREAEYNTKTCSGATRFGKKGKVKRGLIEEIVLRR